MKKLLLPSAIIFIFSLSAHSQGLWQANGNDIVFSMRSVGIATSSPTQKLDVAGAVHSFNSYTDSLSQAMSMKAESGKFKLMLALTAQIDNLSVSFDAIIKGKLTADKLIANSDAEVHGKLAANQLLVTGNSQLADVTAKNISAKDITATSVDATKYLLNGNQFPLSPWTINPDGTISFNGQVLVKRLDAVEGISIGNFKFKNGAVPAPVQRDTISAPNKLVIESQTKAIELSADTVTMKEFVGIGKTPTSALDVAGDIKASQTISSDKITANSLQVQNDVTANGNLRLSNLSGTGDRMLLVDGNGNLKSGNPFPQWGSTPWMTGGNYVTPNVDYLGTRGADDLIIKTNADNDPNSERMRITTTGNVGIGTIPNTLSNTQGNYKVDVNGDLRVITGAGTTPGGNIVLKTGLSSEPPNFVPVAKVGIGTENPVRALHIYTEHHPDSPPPPPCTQLPCDEILGTHHGVRLEDLSNSVRTIWDIAPAGGKLYFSKGDPNNDHAVDSKMTILNNGNIGIGTNAPTAKLHVGGTAGVDGIRFPDGTLQTSATVFQWTSSGNNIFYNPAGGGKIFIATDPSQVIGTSYELNVCGTIHSKEVIIEATTWCDFKLKPGYKRMTWQEKLAHIETFGYLPEMDSGLEIETKGLKVAKNLRGMIWNIEDNAMDIIDLYQIIKKQNEAIAELKKEVEQLKEKK